MKPINKETLQIAASKLFFTMNDSEYETLLKEFDIVYKQINIISARPDVDKVEPMTFPFDVGTSYLREDETEEPLSQEDVLRNAKDVEDGQIIIPRVVKK